MPRGRKKRDKESGMGPAGGGKINKSRAAVSENVDFIVSGVLFAELIVD